jgi:ribosome-associated protein
MAEVSRDSVGGDLSIAARPGLPGGLVIPNRELIERFSRSSGPGGQSVNTADSRVELRWGPSGSSALREDQRERLIPALGARLVDGEVVIFASEHRSQLQNRVAARARLAALIAEGLAPPAPARRATRPSRRARAKRVDAKKHRSEIKTGRGRVSRED